jgi:drug/metabolite transporter (DMT)-like permease
MRWPGQMLLVGLIWGASFMFIKVELDDGIAPLHVAWLRCAFGALALAAILRARGERFPRDRALLRHLVVVAGLMNAVPFVLFAYGETEVSSLLAGIFNATTPLLTLLFSLAVLPDERPTALKVAGLLVGFTGVLVVLGPWEGIGGGSLLGALACLGASTCYGMGFPYMRRNLAGRPESAVAISAAQVSIGAILLLPTVFLSPVDGSLELDSAGSILALGALGTGVAYALNFNVIREAGAQTASTVTYIVPIFAVLFGVTLLSEPLSWHAPAGGLLILAGVTLSTRTRLDSPHAPVQPVGDASRTHPDLPPR